MRKALIVGVDYYTSPLGCLYGCVNDALKVKNVLEQHSDQRANFGAKLVTATNEATAVTRAELKDHVRDLFAGDNEIELILFRGTRLSRHDWRLSVRKRFTAKRRRALTW